jgi:transcriptional regulator with XRE-family HTH domain
MSKFSDWLNEQMKLEGVSMSQLATYAGLSYSGVSKLSLGQRHPEPETVLKLANYFKVDPDWLLELAGHRKSFTPEKDWATVNDPELRYWLSAENLNELSAASRRAIKSIIQAEIEERKKEADLDQAGNIMSRGAKTNTNDFSLLKPNEMLPNQTKAVNLAGGTTGVVALTNNTTRQYLLSSVFQKAFFLYTHRSYWLFLIGTLVYSQVLSTLIGNWVSLFSDWREVNSSSGLLVTFLAYAIGLWCIPTLLNITLLPFALRSQNRYFGKYQARYLNLRHWDWILLTPLGAYCWFAARCLLPLVIEQEQK